MIFIGIDPGKNGGISFIDSKKGDSIAFKTPDVLLDLFEILRDLRNASDDGVHAYLEQVSSRPGQSSVATFTFGRGYGHLEMALVANEIPFERVTPQKWQKALGCLTKGNKNVTKQKAQELFPKIKVTHAIADSLLIAEYGRRAYTGRL